MKLQGVIILRLPDLRRFFTLEEFYSDRTNFLSLVDSAEKRAFFCDDPRQQSLCLQVVNWLQDKSPDVLLKDGELILKVDGSDMHLPLGRIAKYVAEYSKSFREKDLKGLVALYLMLGAEQTDSDIEIQFFPISTDNKQYIGPFVTLYDDFIFPMVSKPEPPIERKMIINRNRERNIHVSCGDKTIDLGRNDDVIVGLFTKEGCYRLLPNRLQDSDRNITLHLRLSPSAMAPTLEIHRPQKMEKIPDVYAIALEGGSPVYVDGAGDMVFDERCVGLNMSYDTLQTKISPDDKLLAVEKIDASSYRYVLRNKTPIIL